MYDCFICLIEFVFDSVVGDTKSTDAVCEEIKDDTELSIRSCENSAVFSSLPVAIKWLRDTIQRDQGVRFQVFLSLLEIHI